MDEKQMPMSDIKLPEPYAWLTVGGCVWRTKGAESDTPLFADHDMEAYAEARAKQAAEMERERILDLLNDVQEPEWYGRGHPYTFHDGVIACHRAIRGTK